MCIKCSITKGEDDELKADFSQVLLAKRLERLQQWFRDYCYLKWRKLARAVFSIAVSSFPSTSRNFCEGRKIAFEIYFKMTSVCIGRDCGGGLPARSGVGGVAMQVVFWWWWWVCVLVWFFLVVFFFTLCKQAYVLGTLYYLWT